MSTRRLPVLCVLGLALFGTAGQALAASTPCAQLTALTLEDIHVTSAVLTPAGTFTASGSGRAATPVQLPSFCRVIALATPSSDSVINFEVWLPLSEAWNGKFEGVGNNAFQGSINYADLASGLLRGYATASTDTGHIGDDLKFANKHPEKIVDWGFRAIHLTTEAAKLIVRDYEGRAPQHSYFDGCNTGGHQGLMEAQRYPDDYDGIVAGDPAADRIHEVAGYLWAWKVTHDQNSQSLLSHADLQLLTKSAVAACDARDGVKDGVIDDPRRCHFNPETLLCRGQEHTDCLAAPQIEAAKNIYAGLHNPRTGKVIFPGWPFGSEGFGDTPNLGWNSMINTPEPRRVQLFQYFVFNDPNWDWRTFDFDKDIDYADEKVGFISATNPDLDTYKSHGGKLLMYTGWADPILPAQDVVDYYDDVTRTMGSAAHTTDFFRLFMVPGMGHCSGGPGTTQFDMLSALEQWVEQKKPPVTIPAAHTSHGVLQRTRPLCMYPKIANWTGNGSTDNAANFVCSVEAPLKPSTSNSHKGDAQ
jgi:feruloyl esterase